MKEHTVDLVYGEKYGIYSSINVSPSEMIKFLSQPFEWWMYKKNYESMNMNMSYDDFHDEAWETSSLDLEGECTPKCFEWIGIHVHILEDKHRASLFFTTGHINFEFKFDKQSINKRLVDKIEKAKRELDE